MLLLRVVIQENPFFYCPFGVITSCPHRQNYFFLPDSFPLTMIERKFSACTDDSYSR